MMPYPEIPSLKLGPLEFHPFGALVAIGFMVGTHLAARRARQVTLNPQPIYDVSLLCIIFGLLGAHVGEMLFYQPKLLLEKPLEIFKIWSGLSSYGGFLGAGIATFLYFKKKKLRFLPYMDALMFGLVPAWFFGRLGCYTAHDHPGRLSNFFLAVKYPDGSRHDLGLYEVFLSVAILLLLHWVGRRKEIENPVAGTIYGITMMSYGIARFFLDFLRASGLAQSDARYLNLTPAQYFSVGFFLFGTYLVIRGRTSRQATES
jgi:phosphatidylglycerol:prolipoprotein diacylglycerol transferase